MAENDPTQDPNEPDPNAPDPDDAALVAEVEDLTRPSSEKDQDKVKNALIAAKRELRSANRRVKELEPIAASATDISTKLSQAQPIINAVLSNPKLLAEAHRIANGTNASRESTEQPDDADLTAFAEDSGWYLADGTTPDAARAGRVLARLDARHGKQTGELIKPLAGVTLNARASENIRGALSATDADGTPWASRESIEEVVKQLPRELLADPTVTDLILNTAIGVDRRKGRTPKPPEEPLFLERQGGGRQREAPLSQQERAGLAKLGISEKEYRQAGEQLATGRGIELGK